MSGNAALSHSGAEETNPGTTLADNRGMEPFEYLILCTALVGTVLALSHAAWGGVKPKKKPRELSRWRTFHVHCGALHGRRSAARTPVVADLNGEVELRLTGDSSASQLTLKDDDGHARIRIQRGSLLSPRVLKVDLDRRPLLRVRPPFGLRRRHAIEFIKPNPELRIQGDPKIREYEVRHQGRLVGIVSRQGRDSLEFEDLDKDSYVVETLKTEKCLPLLALALGVEVALGPSRSWDV